MKEDIKTGLVIMASGQGKRFGGNKLMEPLENQPLIKWVIDAADKLFDKRVVVTRYGEIKALCEESGAECILHELPDRNDTVRLGLEAIMQDIDYCFFAQGDQPLIKRQTLLCLAEKARTAPGHIVRTCYGDIVGSPVGFPREFFEELQNLPTGKGGSWIIKNNPSRVCTVEAQSAYELWDIDTAEDLEKIKKIIMG